MRVEKTGLKDCFVVIPSVYKDDRGYFFESFNQKEFNAHTGINVNFVQDNQSLSQRGVLRGLHFQKGAFAQAKLVRVIKGSVLDVCVDLRKESPTFKKSFSIVLDDTENKQLFIPRGFAHGFLVLEDNTIFSYKCDNYYSKDHEGGIIYNDPQLAVDWGIGDMEINLSEKDRVLPLLEELVL
ncbi:dTDP-4-dehydrorhamnose 3,5-epimerase [Mangrovimonas aestuarii]|uniref:dTDP-4-dehydrorhamnose 3,5-epimerase n=1 Tax=Mangrovimonas aestuarii TaxID=3018443 RepID=UPI002379C22E|nr:dTDP-4-dehydrorhamnose 3,5-epimerase [Mangrovimonas aestuarii]